MEPQQKDPKRRSVYVDGAFVVGLHEETIILARLKVGQQVDGAALVEAVKRDEQKRAWDAALTLLSASAKSRREVERRLARTYPPEICANVVERLVSGGWLDDAEFARSYIRAHSSYGEQRLLGELIRKGVSRDIALAAVRDALQNVDSVGQAREAAEQRLRRMAGLDRDTAQRRLAGFLARRGYDFETISRALAPLLSDLPRAPRAPRMGLSRRRSDEEES